MSNSRSEQNPSPTSVPTSPVGKAKSPASVVVVDYGIGNLRSAQKAFEFIGANVELTDSPRAIEAADAVVLPGVGSFGPTMGALRSSGLDDSVRDFINSGRPFLGICVGMQVLYEGSEESPGVDGLGLIPGVVRELPGVVRRPQMQWNTVNLAIEQPSGAHGPVVDETSVDAETSVGTETSVGAETVEKSGDIPEQRGSSETGAQSKASDNGLFTGLGDSPWLYFVHSFGAEISRDTVAICDYGVEFSAAIRRSNVFATQFHPEKSGRAGLRILSNFVDLATSDR